MRNIVHIVGARPNFIKVGPVYQALSRYSNINQFLVHTGQHYDYNMSDVFFKQLGLPEPTYNLGIHGGSVVSQIGKGLIKIEEILRSRQVDLLCLYGDINATSIGAIAAANLGIKIAHIEAGLRSFDRSMPEEINRVVTDALSHYLFTPSEDANRNLLMEGKLEDQIFLVGNVMIDTLMKFLPKAREMYSLHNYPFTYGLVTIHRPSNVDDVDKLKDIMETLERLSRFCTFIFPIHPRTKSRLSKEEWAKYPGIKTVDPLSYFEFIALEEKAKLVITDSGGVQEESTFLRVPCFTLRSNTERPITVTMGSNRIVGTNTDNLENIVADFFGRRSTNFQVPDFWDGKSGERIAKIIQEILS